MRNKSLGKIVRISSFIAVCASLLCTPSSVIAAEKTLIFPIPQQMELTSDLFELDETITIVVPENKTEKDLFLAHFLVRELSDKYGIALKIESQSDIPEGRKVVVMGSTDNPLIKQYLLDNKLDVTDKDPGPEGYLLHVSSHKIVIAGWDDAGAFFGLQSLRQLIDAGDGEEVQGLRVRDWPNLPFRAIRLYVPGPENIAFFKRFLRDFMALYKYNKVIIEMTNMRLDTHPEVNAGWVDFANDLNYSRTNRLHGLRGEPKDSHHYDAGDRVIIEKNEIRDIVDLAHENFIEVIPEIPSLTHSFYLLTRHPELAEYPGDLWPDTYCPSNPATYDLLFDVLDEYIDVIHPRMIHIGHDEWRMPLDVCPLCKGKDYSDLYAQDINKIYNHLSEKGIKVAMWGDHLLESVRNAGPRETVSATGFKYLRPGGLRASVVEESIPKDILILNWFWDDQAKDVELFDFGFTQLYGNFGTEIKNWNERIKHVDVIGGAPSSWAATNEYNFGKDLLSNFVGCSNLLWSTHQLDQADLDATVLELIPSIRSYLRAEIIPSEDNNVVEPIDISSYFNFSKDSNVFNIDLSTLKSGEVYNRSKLFNLVSSADVSGNCAIAVGSIGVGDNPLPNEAIGIPINEDVSSLIFLQACAQQAENEKSFFNTPNSFDSADLLGFYEIVYEDGFKVIAPVQYGVNALEWNSWRVNREKTTPTIQDDYCYMADPIQCSSNEKDNPITFFAYEWVNPRFDKKIKEVNVFGSVNYQSISDEGNSVTKPMPGNAILLIGISKVKKRERFIPELMIHNEN